MRRRAASILLLGTTLSALGAGDPDKLAHFESKIRPVLVKSCYECHSIESGKAKGGLRLDDREAVLRGGDDRVAAGDDVGVVPGAAVAVSGSAAAAVRALKAVSGAGLAVVLDTRRMSRTSKALTVIDRAFSSTSTPCRARS